MPRAASQDTLSVHIGDQLGVRELDGAVVEGGRVGEPPGSVVQDVDEGARFGASGDSTY